MRLHPVSWPSYMWIYVCRHKKKLSWLSSKKQSGKPCSSVMPRCASWKTSKPGYWLKGVSSSLSLATDKKTICVLDLVVFLFCAILVTHNAYLAVISPVQSHDCMLLDLLWSKCARMTFALQAIASASGLSWLCCPSVQPSSALSPARCQVLPDLQKEQARLRFCI